MSSKAPRVRGRASCAREPSTERWQPSPTSSETNNGRRRRGAATSWSNSETGRFSYRRDASHTDTAPARMSKTDSSGLLGLPPWLVLFSLLWRPQKMSFRMWQQILSAASGVWLPLRRFNGSRGLRRIPLRLVLFSLPCPLLKMLLRMSKKIPRATNPVTITATTHQQKRTTMWTLK